LEDGKLHKGFTYGDASYNFHGKKKKRDLSTNESDYFGLPYRTYSATNGYTPKIRIYYVNHAQDSFGWFMDEKNLNKDQGRCRYEF
jgi:hypothetical protein